MVSIGGRLYNLQGKLEQIAFFFSFFFFFFFALNDFRQTYSGKRGGETE